MIENLGKYAHPPKAGNKVSPNIIPGQSPSTPLPGGRGTPSMPMNSVITQPSQVMKRAAAALKITKPKGPMKAKWPSSQMY